MGDDWEWGGKEWRQRLDGHLTVAWGWGGERTAERRPSCGYLLETGCPGVGPQGWSRGDAGVCVWGLMLEPVSTELA